MFVQNIHHQRDRILTIKVRFPSLSIHNTNAGYLVNYHILKKIRVTTLQLAGFVAYKRTTFRSIERSQKRRKTCDSNDQPLLALLTRQLRLARYKMNYRK